MVLASIWVGLNAQRGRPDLYWHQTVKVATAGPDSWGGSRFPRWRLQRADSRSSPRLTGGAPWQRSPLRAHVERFFWELSADTMDPYTSDVVRRGTGERIAGGTCTSGPRGVRRGIVGRERAAELGRTLRFSLVKRSHSFSFMFLFSVLIHIYFETILNLNEFHL